jgi:cobalt transporter subunit CbtB
MTTRHTTVSVSISQRIVAGFMALFVGSALLYGVAFAQDARLHNAAHDTRHAVGFPCH